MNYLIFAVFVPDMILNFEFMSIPLKSPHLSSSHCTILDACLV